MATPKQSQAARRNITRARDAAASKRTTRAELYEIARRRDLPGRSKMGRDELARKLGEK